MADIKLKKSDFFKKDNGKVSGISKEGTAAVMVDAAKLRQVMTWIEDVDTHIADQISAYDLKTNDIQPNSQVVRLNKLNDKLAYNIREAKKELSSTLSSYTNTKVAALREDLALSVRNLTTYTDTKVADLQDELELSVSNINTSIQTAVDDLSAAADATISKKVSRIYHYEGFVVYVEDLPADLTDSDDDIGKCYNILSGYDPSKDTPQTIKVNPGDNAVWDGTGWDILAGTVDVSNFATKEDVAQLEERVNGSISEHSNNLNRKITDENERAVGVETILSSALDDLSGTTEKSGIIFQFATKLYVDETFATKDDLTLSVGNLETSVQDAKEYVDTVSAAIDTRDKVQEIEEELTAFATKQEVQEALDKVHSHDNLSVLSGISEQDVDNWNAAEENAKNYANEKIAALSDVYDEKNAAALAEENAKNYTDEQITALYDVFDTKGAAETAEQNAKDYADETFATKTEVEDAISHVHSHDNKEALDTITSEKIDAWDAAEQNANVYTDEQISLLSDVYETKGTAQSIVDEFGTTVLKVDGSNVAYKLSVDGVAGKVKRGTYNVLTLFDNGEIKLEVTGARTAADILDTTVEKEFSLEYQGTAKKISNPVVGDDGNLTFDNTGFENIPLVKLLSNSTNQFLIASFVVRVSEGESQTVFNTVDMDTAATVVEREDLDEYATTSALEEKGKTLSSKIDDGLANKLDSSEVSAFAKLNEENCFAENQSIAPGKTIYQQYEDSIPQRYITAKDLDEYDGLAEKREIIEQLDFLSSMNIDDLTVSSLIERLDTILTILKNN